MGTIRRQVRIERPAADVWAIVGDPSSLHAWFPGIVTSTVEGDIRTITTLSGLSLPEQIVTNDGLQRRFQYRLKLGMIENHLGTVDVIGLDDDSCLVVYGTDCTPDVMALIIGGATGAALAELRLLCEGDPSKTDVGVTGRR